MATIGLFRRLVPADPKNLASLIANRPSSPVTTQAPLPGVVSAGPTTGAPSTRPLVEPGAAGPPNASSSSAGSTEVARAGGAAGVGVAAATAAGEGSASDPMPATASAGTFGRSG